MQTLVNTIKKKKKYFLALLLVVAIVFFGQKSLNNTESETTKELMGISVEKGTIANSIAASGIIETANFLSITTSVNGIVKEVYVKEGDAVTKGQAIMEITLNSDGEESRLQAWNSYLSAKSSLESAKTGFYTKESALINAEEAFDDEKETNSYQTHDERVSYKLAENSYLTAKADYDAQKEAIARAEVALSKAWLSYQAQAPTIVAPDNGIIANIVVVEGMDISNSLSERTSTSVASIKKEGTPIVALDINELDINNVSVNQEARVTLASVDNQTFMGKVVGIDKIGTSSGGVTTYTAIIKFDKTTDLALPGMNVDAEIIIEEHKDVVYVPAASITTKQGKSFVIQLTNGTETQKEVELGISDGTNIEILSGITEGDIIMVSALPTSGFTDTNKESDRRGMPPGGMGGMGGMR
jgi:HlyD family secretion protein